MLGFEVSPCSVASKATCRGGPIYSIHLAGSWLCNSYYSSDALTGSLSSHTQLWLRLQCLGMLLLYIGREGEDTPLSRAINFHHCKYIYTLYSPDTLGYRATSLESSRLVFYPAVDIICD